MYFVVIAIISIDDRDIKFQEVLLKTKDNYCFWENSHRYEWDEYCFCFHTLRFG